MLFLAANSRSVAQERLDDAGDTEARVNVNGPDLVYEALAVDGSEKFALDVAGFVESVLVRWLDFDMKGESSPGCGQGCDDHERERWPERIRWTQYQCRTVGCRLSWIWLSEVDQPEIID